MPLQVMRCFFDYSVIALTLMLFMFCSLVLKRFRPSRWLPGITILWGAITTLMGLVKK